ncbi:MAG: PIN domain nuclease [Mycobacterium sp.]
MILIDTSAWIEYFRATGSTAAVRVRDLLRDTPDQVAMCEPIAMEILAGATGEHTWATLERLVNGLPSLGVDNAVDFRAAASIYRAARRSGQTVRSIIDCLIAAIAIRHGAQLIHRDADFEVIAQMANLAAISLR